MIDWNIVVTVKEHGYRQASDILRDFGTVSRTDFFNVMVMRVDDALQFVEDLHACLQSLPGVRASLARVMPVTEKFSYQSAEEFEACVRQQVELWLPRLAGKAFHVRMHRRGFKGRLSSQNEELFLVITSFIVCRNAIRTRVLISMTPTSSSRWRPSLSTEACRCGTGNSASVTPC
jgi:hypothetical protein